MITVRKAVASDLKFINHLQDRFRHQIGYLPNQALLEYIASYHVQIAFENDAPAGFLLGRDSTRFVAGDAAIYQAAVEYDAQHRAVGTTLVDRFIATLAPSAFALHLWCAQDIEANLFWDAQRFEAVGWRLGSVTRQRLVLWWRRILNAERALPTAQLPTVVTPGLVRSRRVVFPILDGQGWRDVKLSDATSALILPALPAAPRLSPDDDHRVQRGLLARPHFSPTHRIEPLIFDPSKHVKLIISGVTHIRMRQNFALESA